jgi:hypothetical protein
MVSLSDFVVCSRNEMKEKFFSEKSKKQKIDFLEAFSKHDISKLFTHKLKGEWVKQTKITLYLLITLHAKIEFNKKKILTRCNPILAWLAFPSISLIMPSGSFPHTVKSFMAQTFFAKKK